MISIETANGTTTTYTIHTYRLGANLNMKKAINYMGIPIGLLTALGGALVIYRGIYPDLSEIRKQCSKVEVGMTMGQAEEIVSDLLSGTLYMAVADEKHIFLKNNGVDCSIDFDNEGKVINVTSAVDAF